jgi:nitric oxide reductase NorD protein
MPKPPLNHAQLLQHLQDTLGWMLPKQRDLAPIAASLAQLPQQSWVLEWVQILIPQNVEITYQFLSHAATALQLMDEDGVEAWLRDAIVCFESQGLKAAIAHLQNVSAYTIEYKKQNQGITLVSVQRVLQTFLTALGGRNLNIMSAEEAYTDTETLFLPATLNIFPTPHDNFLLYKAIVAQLWAQNYFGTWSLDFECVNFPDTAHAWELFHVLERLRLDACLARQLAGLEREIQQLTDRLGEKRTPRNWEAIAQELAQPSATIHDSYHLLNKVLNWEVPPPVCYQGKLNPAAVAKILPARMEREQQAFQAKLARLQHSENAKIPDSQKPVENAPEFKIKQQNPKQLIIDGQMLPLPPDMQKLVASIVQDQGGLPEHYLLGGRGAVDSEQVAPPLPSAPDAIVFTYPEWDYRRKNYHKNHCFLREVEIIPQNDDFVKKTLIQYRGLLKNLRQVFESLRGDNCWLKRQTDGEEIDLDALIMAQVDASRSGEMSQQVFAKWHQQQRSVAVMFMVDMSGSTKGWINLAERESLVLLCEVLETLGDAYAIYGFSGSTRKRCEVYPIKRFSEAYNSEIKQRISGIQAQAYTRMGVTIRHLSQLLQKTEAKIKLLITLSDGKPDDEGDNYRGYYGIEDTRQALFEAKRDGIHAFCITIDKTAKSYLPHLYGAVNYTVIDQVAQLPLKISDIYRKLTT